MTNILVCDDDKEQYTKFTQEEQKVMMTLWCIFRSPLMIGAEMRDNDEFTLSLLTNKKLLNMHKHGRKAREVSRKDDMVIWKSQTKDGKVYVAVFNIGEKDAATKIKFKYIGLDTDKEYTAVDIWENTRYTLKDKKEVELKPHSVRCFEIEV